MYSFFVLGQIPGTSIVISFTMWLSICMALLLIVLAIFVRRHVHISPVAADEMLPPTLSTE